MSINRIALILLLVGSPVLTAASTNALSRNVAANTREQQMWNLTTHDSNFNGTGPVAIFPRCAVTEAPEALATPDPMLALGHANPRVTVSFIVGTDGRVHDPLVLESSGAVADRVILSAVESWRFRPATCNGAPMEVEGTIAFSGR